MRLDLFLKNSRVCPRRTIAQKLCDAGLVYLNGVTAKPSHSVKPGDEIVVSKKNKITTLKVLELPTTRQTPREDAKNLVQVISEREVDRIE
jgi:ribosomal 50S subunit-recycling heat shock protein